MKLVRCEHCQREYAENGLKRHQFFCDPKVAHLRKTKMRYRGGSAGRGTKLDERMKLAIPDELKEKLRAVAFHQDKTVNAIILSYIRKCIDYDFIHVPSAVSPLQTNVVPEPLLMLTDNAVAPLLRIDPHTHLGKRFPFVSGKSDVCPICGDDAPDVGGMWKCTSCKLGGRVSLVNDTLLITRVLS